MYASKQMIKLEDSKEINGLKYGSIRPEQDKGKPRLKYCKGIYQNEIGQLFAAFQYLDKKRTRQEKKPVVSGKSPFWFEQLSLS